MYRRRFMPRVTEAELILHQAMAKAGLHFRSQEPVKAPNEKTYILDFLVENKLNVEVNGITHKHPTRIAKDEERDRSLTEMGLTVIRFKEKEVKKHPGKCVKTIKSLLEK